MQLRKGVFIETWATTLYDSPSDDEIWVACITGLTLAEPEDSVDSEEDSEGDRLRISVRWYVRQEKGRVVTHQFFTVTSPWY